MHSSDAVILVVEDEILIRMDVVDQLTGLGYSVIEASTGREALETLTTGDGVCIQFTDVDMPGDLDGIMLAHEVSRTRPEIGIIVTPGKTALGEDALPEGSRFCSKPYIQLRSTPRYRKCYLDRVKAGAAYSATDARGKIIVTRRPSARQS